MCVCACALRRKEDMMDVRWRTEQEGRDMCAVENILHEGDVKERRAGGSV